MTQKTTTIYERAIVDHGPAIPREIPGWQWVYWLGPETQTLTVADREMTLAGGSVIYIPLPKPDFVVQL